MDAREIPLFISHRVDYDKSDWLSGGVQSRARRRNCRHSNSAPERPEAPAKAGSSGPTKMQELAGNGSPPSTAASPVSTSKNWPPPALGARPLIAVQGGIR